MADTSADSPTEPTRSREKSAAAFRTISEVATALDVPQHVLRFWETRFPQIKPLKRGGGRRYYRPEDVALLQNIRRLLYAEGYTIKGVQRLMRDGALKAGRDATVPAPVPESAEKPAPHVAAPPPERDGGSLPDEARRAIRAAIAELEDVRKALTDAR